MAIVKTPRAILGVLDSEGKITGYELEYFATYEAEGPDDPMAGMFQPQIKRDLLSAEDSAKFWATSDKALLTENKALHQQIADMQESVKASSDTLVAAKNEHEKALDDAQARVNEAQMETKQLANLLAQVKAILS